MKKIVLSMAFLACGASIGMLQGCKLPYSVDMSNYCLVRVDSAEMNNNVSKILKMQDVPHDVFLAALQLQQGKKFDELVLDKACEYCQEICEYEFAQCSGNTKDVIGKIKYLARRKNADINGDIKRLFKENKYEQALGFFLLWHSKFVSELTEFRNTTWQGTWTAAFSASRPALFDQDINFLNSQIESLNKLVALNKSDKNLLYGKVKSFIDGSVREIIPDIVRSFETIKSGLSNGTVQLSSEVIKQLKSFEGKINDFIKDDKLDVNGKDIINKFKIEIQEVRCWLENANSQIEEAKKEKEEINKKLQKSGAENEALKAQVSETNEKLQAVGTQLSSQGEKLKASEEENKDLKRQVSEKSGELQEVQQKCAELERNIIAFKKEKSDIDISNNQTVVKGMIAILKGTFNKYWGVLPERERLDIARCINEYIIQTVENQSIVVNIENLNNIEAFAPVFNLIPGINGKFQFFDLLNSLVLSRISFNFETTRTYSDQRAECNKILEVKNPFAFTGNWETNAGKLTISTSGGNYFFIMEDGNVSVCNSKEQLMNSSCFWNMNFWNKVLKLGKDLSNKKLGVKIFFSEEIMIIGNDNASNKRLLCVEKDVCFVSQFECRQKCANATMEELFIPSGSEVTFCKGDYNGSFTLAEKMPLSAMYGLIEAEAGKRACQPPLMIAESRN